MRKSPGDILIQILAGYAALALIAAIVGAVGLGFFWLSYSQDGLRKIRDTCDFDATKIFALQIAKWKDEHGTDIMNPYRRQKDELVQQCVTKSEKWCVVSDNLIWPGTFLAAFAPRDKLMRWIFAEWYLGGRYPGDCH